MRNEVINGNFYFCYKEDLTISYSKRFHNPKMPTDRKFFWNEDLLKIFARHKLPLVWRIPIMQGFVNSIKMNSWGHEFTYTNISRRSKYMSGTRFKSRGLDSKARPANFV